jgi:AcrR family transcriptional regulator
VAGIIDGGRVNQKRRTYQAIVEAARRLLNQGRAPTVEEAADAALVSRATAYRYFSSQDELLLQAAAPALPPPEVALAGVAHSTDPVERIRHAARAMQQQCIEREPEIRAVLRLSMERWLQGAERRDEAVMIRPAHRVGWIAEAVAPLNGHIPRRDLRRLELALATVMGTEALLALRDVCRVDYQTAVETAVWAAGALVEATTRAADDSA